jgi:hypothetical protein
LSYAARHARFGSGAYEPPTADQLKLFGARASQRSSQAA